VPAFTWLDAVMFLVAVLIYVTLLAVGPDLGPKEGGAVYPNSRGKMNRGLLDTRHDTRGISCSAA
jgi:hypothetical protein